MTNFGLSMEKSHKKTCGRIVFDLYPSKRIRHQSAMKWPSDLRFAWVDGEAYIQNLHLNVRFFLGASFVLLLFFLTSDLCFVFILFIFLSFSVRLGYPCHLWFSDVLWNVLSIVVIWTPLKKFISKRDSKDIYHDQMWFQKIVSSQFICIFLDQNQNLSDLKYMGATQGKLIWKNLHIIITLSLSSSQERAL